MIRVTIEPTGRVGSRGPRYRATYEGEVIVTASIAAEYDACRALLARGITGRMVTFGQDGKPRLSMDIEKSAQLTVTEGDGRVRIVPWRAFEGREGTGGPDDDESASTARPRSEEGQS